MQSNNENASEDQIAIKIKETEVDDKIISNQKEIMLIDGSIKKFTIYAKALFVLGLLLALTGLAFYYFQPATFTLDKLGAYTGGMVISAWSLAGTLIIYIGFLGQKQQLKYQEIQSQYSRLELMQTRFELSGQKSELIQQNKNLKLQAFENCFFGMVKAQRQMVYEMKFNSPDEFEIRQDSTAKYSMVVSGHRVFAKIFKQLQEARQEINEIFDANIANLFLNNKIEQVEIAMIKTRFSECNHIKLKEITLSNVSFLIILYGVGEEGRILRNSLAAYYSEKFVNDIITTIRLKPAKYSVYWNNYTEKKFEYKDAKYPKYYGGHLHRLDQYYRLLFKIIFFVDEQKGLDFNEKYKYVSFLRTQLTTYEQAVFFINSLSFTGRQWELKPKKPMDNWQKPENLQLITKYNMIRNIPSGFIMDIKFEEYYPLVSYEGTHLKKEKSELNLRYT